ncbi:MAG: SusD/RagB family nutrient-binding outer membrane lipoprotein [Muribaculaceae bacterium]|nr:SusD/RagB family nutrient-binding outer membrane lipoprotein [Muribaculaceae bacterium]
MNKIKILLLSLLVGLTMSSCEDTLSENVNPDVAHTNTPNLCLPIVVFYAQQIVYDHAEYNVFLSQCLTTTGKAQQSGLPYRSGWEFLNINRHPQWRRHYYDLGANIVNLVKDSGSSTSNYALIGRTVRLMSTQLTTDAFGDMPLYEAQAYSDMYGNELLTPRYESQAAVYKWMFEEADALIDLFENEDVVNNPNNKLIDVSQDRVYAGDLKKWKGLVYAIKARLLLRNLPNIDRSVKICDEIVNTVDKAIAAWRTGDLMYGEWFGNEPRYKFDGGSGEQNCPWGPVQPVINSWESRANGLTSAVPSKFFIQDCMGVINPGIELKQGLFDGGNGYGADPRLMLLMLPMDGPVSAANDDKETMIRYLENNIGAGSTFKQANYPELFMGAYAKNDGYNPIFTMEELYFIKAEAEYWKGNKTTACELAKTATKWNIERHLERFKADNGGFYPGSGNVAAKPTATAVNKLNMGRFERMVTAFLDNQGSLNTKRCDQIGQKHWFFNENEYSLSDLMIQKWIAMYMQPEQWTDMRRYHYSNNRNGYGIGDANEIVYPTLRRPYNLYSAYWVDGLTDAEKENTWIQRLNYDPQTEDIYNMNEVIRVGAYKDYKWLQKPMNWALDYGVRSSLIAE